jgi:hypothetical protein
MRAYMPTLLVKLRQQLKKQPLSLGAVGRCFGDLGRNRMEAPFVPYEMYFLSGAGAVALHKFEYPAIGIRRAGLILLGRREIHPRSNGVIPMG